MHLNILMRGTKPAFYFYVFNPFVFRIKLTIQTQCYIYFDWRLQSSVCSNEPDTRKGVSLKKMFNATKEKEKMASVKGCRMF